MADAHGDRRSAAHGDRRSAALRERRSAAPRDQPSSSGRRPLPPTTRTSCGSVAMAGSAAEGLTRILERPPDVLLSDLEMPGEDGYELSRDPEPPIVVGVYSMRTISRT